MMRGTTGPAAGAPGAPAPSGAGPALAEKLLGRLFAQQQVADPGYVAQQLRQTQSIIASMIPKTIGHMEGVATELAPILRHLERAIKNAEEAGTLKQAVSRPPIGFSGAGQGPGGAMGGGGGMGGMGGMGGPLG